MDDATRPPLAVDPETVLGTAVTAAGSDRGAPTLIPASRYWSPAWFALEQERLWPRVWQIAGTVDHVAEPGDVLEYQVGPYSVLIVRGDDGELRAFQNSCRHRGNVLCTGSASGLTELRCPFHNWVWDLQGRLRQVPSRRGFGTLRNEDFPLLAARVGTWGRLVFVNLDLDAMPLDEFLEGVPDDIAWVGLDDFRCTAVVTVRAPCNWKIVADGFSETYHVQGIHAPMLASFDDVNAHQRLWSHHGVSYQRYAVASPRLGRDVPDQAVWDSFVLTQGGRMGVEEVGPAPPVPEGQTITDVVAEQIRAHQARRGVDLSRFDTVQVTQLNQYNLFPNTTVLVSADLFTVLCSRPGAGPEQAELVMYHFERAPSAAAPRARPMAVTMPIEQADLGYVFNQDLEVLKRAQVGVRQPGLGHLAVSSEEARLINTQRNLERYLGIEPSELLGGPVRE